MSKLGDAKEFVFKHLLAFMRQSHVNRFLVGYGAFFGLGLIVYASIVQVIIPTYYAVAPARSFVDYYYAKVADTQVGQEPQLTLCRRINYDNVKIDAVRTFIYLADGQPNESVKEYPFQANVSQGESEGNCINVRLRGQPQVAGKYTTSTSIVFYIGGHRKTYSYPSNEYNMIPADTTDEERIDELQRQIDEINAARGETAPASTPAPQAAPRTQKDPAAEPSDQPENEEDDVTVVADPAPEPDNSVLGRLNQVLRRIGL